MYLGQMTEEEHDDDDGHQSQRLPLLSALHHRPPANRRPCIVSGDGIKRDPDMG